MNTKTKNQAKDDTAETPSDSGAELGGLPVRQIPLDEEVQWILGQLCFEVRRVCRRLEELGIVTCKHRAENEQAAVLHWELNLYLQHGSKWREVGAEILKGEPNSALSNGGTGQ